MLTMLIDANIIMLTLWIWEARAKVTNIVIMKNGVLLTMEFLMYMWNTREARAKVTNIVVMKNSVILIIDVDKERWQWIHEILGRQVSKVSNNIINITMTILITRSLLITFCSAIYRQQWCGNVNITMHCNDGPHHKLWFTMQIFIMSIMWVMSFCNHPKAIT